METSIEQPRRRRGAPRKLSEAKERRVVLAYYEGRLKVEAIANRFGISRTAVYDMVRRNPELAPANGRGSHQESEKREVA